MGEVGRDGFAGRFHKEDRVGGVNEVAVAHADELAELLLLGVDVTAGGGLDGTDGGDGVCAEEGIGVARGVDRRSRPGGEHCGDAGRGWI